MRFKWVAYAMILTGALFLASQVSVAQGKSKGKEKAAKKAQVDKKGKGKGKKPKAAKEWVAVKSWSGSSNKTTDVFEISNEKWRILWENKGKKGSIFGVSVYKPNKKLVSIPANIGNKSAKDTSYVYSKGSFYIGIIAANTSWTVTVEDYKIVATGDDIELSKAPTAPAEMKDPKAMAKESYNNGKKYYKKEDYNKALESFMAAYNYAPNPFVYISIAQCYDKLGKCQEARDYYKKYMEEKPDAGNIPDIKEKIVELESRKGKVSILSDPAGATVTIDGETSEMVTPGSLEMQGGDHALALNLDGYIMETRAFTVPICGDVEISVKLKSAGSVTSITTDEKIDEAIRAVGKEKKPKRKIKLGIPHYVSFGLAGAALITAAVTGGLALQKSNDFADKKDEYETSGDPGLYNDMEDLKSSGRSLAIACDVTIGIAAVAAVAGVALLFLVPKEKKKVAVTPLISPKGGGASLSLNF